MLFSTLAVYIYNWSVDEFCGGAYCLFSKRDLKRWFASVEKGISHKLR